eukprot:5481582-Pleurochrysis_carterae.AAC.2
MRALRARASLLRPSELGCRCGPSSRQEAAVVAYPVWTCAATSFAVYRRLRDEQSTSNTRHRQSVATSDNLERRREESWGELERGREMR